MSHPSTAAAEVTRRPTAAGRALAVAAAASLILAVLVTWFAWPAKELEPRDLPVVVAGPDPAAAAIADRLHTERPGAFAITIAPDAPSADAALRDRRAYAAFVVGIEGGQPAVSLHVASAASPTVATLLSQAAQQLGAGRPVAVVDVVAGPVDDPRGAGFASGFLPLVLVSLIGAVLLSIVVTTKVARLVGVTTFAILAGLVGAAVLWWLGVLDGRYLGAAGVVALLTFAIGSTLTGLAALLGRAGIAVGMLLVFLFGNPISAVAAAPELLPQPWGAIGQLLPPGAGASLLRDVVFFDGAGASAPLWTLVAWAGAGVLLLTVGRAGPVLSSAPATGSASGVGSQSTMASLVP